MVATSTSAAVRAQHNARVWGRRRAARAAVWFENAAHSRSHRDVVRLSDATHRRAQVLRLHDDDHAGGWQPALDRVGDLSCEPLVQLQTLGVQVDSLCRFDKPTTRPVHSNPGCIRLQRGRAGGSYRDLTGDRLPILAVCQHASVTVVSHLLHRTTSAVRGDSTEALILSNSCRKVSHTPPRGHAKAHTDLIGSKAWQQGHCVAYRDGALGIQISECDASRLVDANEYVDMAI